MKQETEDFYENLQVHVEGIGTIYHGQSLKEAKNIFDNYLVNNPHAEIIVVDEKYGDEIFWANIETNNND
jgi:hypothetical protein